MKTLLLHPRIKFFQKNSFVYKNKAEKYEMNFSFPICWTKFTTIRMSIEIRSLVITYTKNTLKFCLFLNTSCIPLTRVQEDNCKHRLLQILDSNQQISNFQITPA